jgi:hypothetical protein
MVDEYDLIDFEVAVTDTVWPRKKNALDFYLVDAWFESLPGHRLSRLRYFMIFPSPSRKLFG